MGDILGDTVDPYALGDESQFDPYGGAYLDDSSYLNQTLEGETDHQTSAGEPQEQEQQQQQQQQQQEEEQQHQQQQQQQQRHQMDEGGSSTNYAFDRNPSNILDPNRPEAGKMFIGGLNWETTDESMRAYFEKYGEVDDCVVMKDPITGRSRGFGFLTFRSSKSVDAVIQLEHTLDGKIIDPKRAIPREEQDRTEKIFVGGVAPEVTEDVFRAYFERFGRVVDATLMTDRETGRPRGFGFITFENSDGVDKAMAKQALGELAINGKLVEVKRAMPKHRLAQMPGAGTVRAPPALALPAAPVYPPMMDSRVSNFGPMRGARAVTAPVGPRMPPRFAPYGAAGAAGANPYAARFAAAAAAAASGDERFAGRMGAYGYPFAGYAAAAAAGYYPGMSGYGYGGRYDPETMAAYAGAYSRGYHPYYGYGMYGGYGGRYGYGSYGAGAAGYAGREGYRRGGGERGEGSSSPPRRVKEGSQGPRSRGEDDSLELAGGMEDHGRPDEVGSGSGVTIKTERDSERDAGGSSSGPQRPSSSWGSRGGRGFHPYAR